METKDLAEKVLDKNIDWVFASDDDKNKFIKAMNDFAEMKAKEFAMWIDDNHWIRDSFPHKGFEDDLLRYSNIGTIETIDDKLELLTIDELYELFKNEMKQQNSNNNQEKIYQYNVFHNIFGEIDKVIIMGKNVEEAKANFKKIYGNFEITNIEKLN